MRSSLPLPPPFDQVLHQLRCAWTIIEAAENAAMAVDGPVSATRDCIGSEAFDVMARHIKRAIVTLERGVGRETYEEALRQVHSWVTADKICQDAFLAAMRGRFYGKDALMQAWESYLVGWNSKP